MTRIERTNRRDHERILVRAQSVFGPAKSVEVFNTEYGARRYHVEMEREALWFYTADLTIRRGWIMFIPQTAKSGWVPAKVGCYWTKGNRTISTVKCGTDSWYALTEHPGRELGRYGTLEQAMEANEVAR